MFSKLSVVPNSTETETTVYGVRGQKLSCNNVNEPVQFTGLLFFNNNNSGGGETMQ